MEVEQCATGISTMSRVAIDDSFDSHIAVTNMNNVGFCVFAAPSRQHHTPHEHTHKTTQNTARWSASSTLD